MSGWMMDHLMSCGSFVKILRPEQNGQYFGDNIFKWIFMKQKSCIFMHISSVVPKPFMALVRIQILRMIRQVTHTISLWFWKCLKYHLIHQEWCYGRKIGLGYFHWSIFLMFQLTVSQYWFTARQQVTVWTNGLFCWHMCWWVSARKTWLNCVMG